MTFVCCFSSWDNKNNSVSWSALANGGTVTRTGLGKCQSHFYLEPLLSSLTNFWLTSDLSSTSTVLPGPNPQMQSEVRVPNLGGRTEWWRSCGATGLGFENRSPRNKCLRDVFSLPGDFRALVWLRTDAGLHQRKTDSLESQTPADFCGDCQVTKFGAPLCWGKASCCPAPHNFISAEQNQTEVIAPGQISWIFSFHLSTKGSWSWELTCLPHPSVHIARPMFPRLQRQTVWCDQRCRSGGCLSRLIWFDNIDYIWDFFFWGTGCY